MAKADTKRKDTTPVDHGDIAGAKNLVTATGGARMRLPYPPSLKEFAQVTPREWQVLIDSIFPSAQTIEAVCMAIAYCKARKLDIMKKPVHIVPVWSSKENRYVETVWPSIAEIRITASRTGAYAGKDATAFGPEVTKNFTHTHNNETEEMEVTFPEWAQVTVYRIVQGVRCAFVGPKVFWEEAYASKSRWSTIPNEMWADRRSGQLEKCAEAAALRAAFPEELGNEYAAEEMAGRVVDTSAIKTFAAAEGENSQEIVNPARPKQSDFERGADKVTGEIKPTEKKGTTRKKKGEAAPKAEAKPEETVDPNEGPYKRGLRLLKGITAHPEVNDLYQTIYDELQEADPGKTVAWTAACDTRFIELGGTMPDGEEEVEDEDGA